MKQEIRVKVKNETKRIEEDTLYSARSHFSAGQFWSSLNLWVGVPTAILAGISGASVLSQLFNEQSNVIAGVLAVLVATITALITFLNPNEKATLHHNAGNQYNSLRNKARIFYEVTLGTDITDKEAQQELKTLNKDRDELNNRSPQIPRWAFLKARQGIEEGEASYKVDKNSIVR